MFAPSLKRFTAINSSAQEPACFPSSCLELTESPTSWSQSLNYLKIKKQRQGFISSYRHQNGSKLWALMEDKCVLVAEVTG